MSTRAFLSADWYRVAPLKPRLRGHVEIHRQIFRGDVWFILQDYHSGKFHRMTSTANYILSLMNGRRTMQEVWEAACQRFAEDPPTQSETIRLLAQLHGADLIASDLPPDIAELGQRHSRQERQSMLARIRNPMALRLPLFDPDRFLTATVPLVRWLFTPFGFLLWLALVGTGVVLLGLHYEELTNGFRDQVLSAENLLIVALAYPVVKAIHELGHGYATKAWGGEVHEIGLMFLVFIPVPYVDASTSAAFDSKWRRAVVGGAGIMVELALASAALIFWIYAEPGLPRAFAFNVMLIGGISTLLFNGNPLLRFDGYFVLSDLIEIPGLGQRSNAYIFYLIRRYLFRVKDARSPVTARGEKAWFFFYALGAFVYRLFISFAIALFVAGKFFVVGIILALWALYNSFVAPVLKGVKYLFTSPELRNRRALPLGLVAGSLAAVAGVLLYLPAPYTTVTHGVVWLGPDDIVRAETEGFVDATPGVAGGAVAGGETVVHMIDPTLDLRIEVLQSRLTETQLRLQVATFADQVQAQLLRDRIALLEDQIADLTARRTTLDVAAPQGGQLVMQDAQNLEGRMIRRGEVLGYVTGNEGLRLRVAVPQAQAELVRGRTQAVEMRFLSDPATPIRARLGAEVPQSQNTVPSLALATEGGGTIALNPAGQSELSTLDSVFQFEVIPDQPLPVEMVGARALVKFDHGREPVGLRAWRGIRQLFLRQFNV